MEEEILIFIGKRKPRIFTHSNATFLFVMRILDRFKSSESGMRCLAYFAKSIITIALQELFLSLLQPFGVLVGTRSAIYRR